MSESILSLSVCGTMFSIALVLAWEGQDWRKLHAKFCLNGETRMLFNCVTSANAMLRTTIATLSHPSANPMQVWLKYHDLGWYCTSLETVYSAI